MLWVFSERRLDAHIRRMVYAGAILDLATKNLVMVAILIQ